jgi:hypothetical protein
MGENQRVDDIPSASEFCHQHAECDQGECAEAVDGHEETDDAAADEVDVGLWQG